MNLREDDLRERVRSLIAGGPDPAADDGRLFRGAQFDAGLAWVSFPVGLGGLALPGELHAVVDGELSAAGVRDHREANNIGHGNAAPMLVMTGTTEQRQRFLRPCFTNEEIWCMLMSEPGAGSDVAGLATRAERDGDEWVVNGQKVWTTLAHMARWGLLIARHDPGLPKHRGITCFIVDMHDPGVEVRPLRQLTGKAEFNEVYLSDVRVPDRMRLGDVGAGWNLVSATLASERLFSGRVDHDSFSDVRERWLRSTRQPSVRQQVARAWIATTLNRVTMARAEIDGAIDPSVVKVLFSETDRAACELALDLYGAEAMLYPDGYGFERPTSVAVDHLDTQERFLNSCGYTIAAGTSQVMRNLIAEKVLGLPREARTDVAVPWRDVPRSVGDMIGR